ncbi:MAG TPA: hypothetical protein ENJ82_17640 [Bacteroidetes bacterium]|nr:hypothetical protein [Bacteroidota bacterium]
MKKSVLIIFILSLIGVMGLSAQTIAGRYTHASSLNADDISIDHIVLTETGNGFQGKWETALATGENEAITELQNVVVDQQGLKLSFEKNGQSHTGQFVSDGDGGYDLILNGQTLYSRKDW